MLKKIVKTFICVSIFSLPLLHTVNGSAQTGAKAENPYAFTAADIQFLKNFSTSALPPLPAAPSNKFADNIDAAKLGREIFFDKRLSKGNKFSCASCHQPERHFTDGLARALAAGETRRSTPTLIGAAWSPWQYWDGRRDSLWSQALSPVEDHNEMAITRSDFVREILRYYDDEYEDIFGAIEPANLKRKISRKASPIGDEKAQKRWQKMPTEAQDLTNQIFTDIGKALMAYQRKIKVFPGRFDYFIDDLVRTNGQASRSLLNEQEVRGMRLFMGKANCASCHNGPLFTNFEFHNIGAPEADETNIDLGRYSGVKDLVADEFTCLSKWSDAKEDECEEMAFLKREGPELVGAIKTPTLRNIIFTAPYMQAGQFKSLEEVITHYSKPQPPFYDREQHPNRPHFDIMPLNLSPEESADIVAFLATLSSPYPENDYWWNPKLKVLRTQN